MSIIPLSSFSEEELQRRLNYLETFERNYIIERGKEITDSYMTAVTTILMLPSTIVYTQEEKERFIEMF